MVINFPKSNDKLRFAYGHLVRDILFYVNSLQSWFFFLNIFIGTLML